MVNFYWQETNLRLKCILKKQNLLIVLVVHLQKNKERIKKFMQTGNASYIYKNDLDKVCFQHDMAYGKYKNLTKR